MVGFVDFLGYHFDGKQLTVTAKTVEKHVVHYRQLYEQLRKKKATSDEMAIALGQYVKRWHRWVKAGIGAWVTPPPHKNGCRTIVHGQVVKKLKPNS